MALIARAATEGSTTELLHDVDNDLDNVLEMAAIEFAHGQKAKYFIRVHAKYYNPFSLPNVRVLKKITSEMHHEVGLHFEPGFYRYPDIARGIQKEAELLEYLCGVPAVRHLSIHEPARLGTIDDDLVPQHLRLYCWGSKYYRDKKYISDSSAHWREGCMCQHIGRHPKLLVLTHPFWWFSRSQSENV
jgi:hypothetical protein